jgi:hypothetical protein
MREYRGKKAQLRACAVAAALGLPIAGVSSVAMSSVARAAGTEVTIVPSETPPPLSRHDFTAVEGQQGVSSQYWVATLGLVINPVNTAAITIDWGDGTAAGAGQLTLNHVVGQHTYREAGTYTVHVTVPLLPFEEDLVKPATALGPLTATATATVTEARSTLNGESTKTVPGGAYTGQIAHGTDSNSAGTLADFSAVINWGDGSGDQPPCTTCIAGSGTGFQVSGTHQFTHAGSYDVKTRVTDGGHTVGRGRVTTDIVVPVVANPLSAVEGAAFHGTVGSVMVAQEIDVAGARLPVVNTVSIDWGDTTAPSDGVIASNGDVSGSHTYAEEGSYTLKLTAGHTVQPSVSTGPPWLGTAKVTVADAAVTATSVNGGAFNGIAGTPFNAKLAHLTDANPGTTLADHSATIDWGDGSSSAGVLSIATGGGFDAAGSHTYSTAGTKHGVVHFLDAGGQVAQAPFTVNVAPAVQLPKTSGGAPAVIAVPKTGGELPIATALLLVASGGALVAVGRRRRS